MLVNSVVRMLKQTKFGQKSLTKSDELSILKQQPSARFYIGIVLLVMSFVLSFPALAFLSYLSVKLTKPMIIAIGGPVVFLLVHVMFGAGVYLAGNNYVLEVLHWVTKRFIQKYDKEK